ncbi:MAG: hypothetical protein ABFD97_08760 [Syntrophobacter sp.]
MSKTKVLLLFVSLSLIIPGMSYAKKSGTAVPTKVITGVLSGFDCEGEPCVLTVVDAKGVENEGICSTPVCEKWDEKKEMPAEYKGKKVKVTVEVSQGGHGRGSLDQFIKIEPLK